MFECKLSVTDFSVVIITENSWMKVFPKDYAKFIDVLLHALRKERASFIINQHAVFWYDASSESSAFTCLLPTPYTDYITDNQIRNIMILLLEAEKLWAENKKTR